MVGIYAQASHARVHIWNWVIHGTFFGITSPCDLTLNPKVNVGCCDLHFIVQECVLICLVENLINKHDLDYESM